MKAQRARHGRFAGSAGQLVGEDTPIIARELEEMDLEPACVQVNGAIGAIDGTHIPAFVPLQKQKRFWSRKSNISQM